MQSQFNESDIESIQYLKSRSDGGFDIVSKGQEDIAKITLKDGRVVWAFPTQV